MSKLLESRVLDQRWQLMSELSPLTQGLLLAELRWSPLSHAAGDFRPMTDVRKRYYEQHAKWTANNRYQAAAHIREASVAYEDCTNHRAGFFWLERILFFLTYA